MSEPRLERVVELYRQKGLLESVDGDFVGTSVDWLVRAAEELSGVDALIGLRQWRLAFNSGYDIYRHAAEALVLHAGFRITSARGAHEAAPTTSRTWMRMTLVGWHRLDIGRSSQSVRT